MDKKNQDTFFELLLTGDVKKTVLDLAGKAINKEVEKKKQETLFCIYMDEFLSIKKNTYLSNQLQVVIEHIKESFLEEIRNGNLDVLRTITIYVEQEFRQMEIPVDEREPLKNNLIQYIKYYIQKTDNNFFNDLIQNDMIGENAASIARLQNQIIELNEMVNAVNRELQKRNQEAIIQITKQLDIEKFDKLDMRENELNTIEQRFQNQQNVVILYGRPGMGKTTMARLYANQFCNGGDARGVCFMTYHDSIENTVASISSDTKKYKGKQVLQYLYSLAPEKRRNLLFVIDNFNEDELQGSNRNSYINEIKGDYFKKLKDSGVRIIITTRIQIDENVLEVQSVENPVELFRKRVKRDISEDEKKTVGELIKLLHGNTLLIVLVAHLWDECDDEKRNRLIESIKDRSMEYYNEDLALEIDGTVENRTIYGQVCSLLDFSGILNDESAKNVLINTALLPLEGISKNVFLELTKKELKNALNRLIQNSWVLEYGNDIALHPLIREVFFKKIGIGYKDCHEYCEQISKRIDMGVSFPKRLPFKSCAWELFNLFSDEKQRNVVLLELFYNLSDIYDELAERERALQLVEVVYNNIDIFNDDLLHKAELLSGCAYTMNNKYRSMKDLEISRGLLNEAKDMMPDIEVTSENKLRRAKLVGKIWSNIGSNYISKGRCDQKNRREYFEKARDYHEKALDYRINQLEQYRTDEKIKGELERFVATSYTNLGTSYYYLEDYESAIENHQQAYQLRSGFGATKLMNDNQQRIIGCVIEIYRRSFEVEERYVQMALDFYPGLLQDNCRFDVKDAFNMNLTYFMQLFKIVRNNRNFEQLVGVVNEKKKIIQDWIESDKDLAEKYLEKIRTE